MDTVAVSLCRTLYSVGVMRSDSAGAEGPHTYIEVRYRVLGT